MTIDDVESLIENFDFEKVRAFMVLTGWKWYKSGTALKTPTVEEMKDAIRDLYYHKTSTSNWISSVGFTLSQDNEECQLSFTLEQKSIYRGGKNA